VHPAIVFSTSADRAEMQALLSTIAQSDGRVVVVDQLTAQANPFIDWIELEVPADARAGDTVTATLRYQSNCYCPRYYFRIYACDDQFGCGIPIWRGVRWESCTD